MTDTRQIAQALAATFATEPWTPEGVERPRVFLDALTQNIQLGKRPGVIVVPRNSTGLWKSTPEHQIEIVLTVDASAHTSNPAALVETPDGVEVFGVGSLLDSLVVAALNMIKRALPGSILADLQVEFSLDNLPMQYATLTLTYRDNPAYKDFCKE